MRTRRYRGREGVRVGYVGWEGGIELERKGGRGKQVFH